MSNLNIDQNYILADSKMVSQDLDGEDEDYKRYVKNKP